MSASPYAARSSYYDYRGVTSAGGKGMTTLLAKDVPVQSTAATDANEASLDSSEWSLADKLVAGRPAAAVAGVAAGSQGRGSSAASNVAGDRDGRGGRGEAGEGAQQLREGSAEGKEPRLEHVCWTSSAPWNGKYLVPRNHLPPGVVVGGRGCARMNVRSFTFLNSFRPPFPPSSHPISPMEGPPSGSAQPASPGGGGGRKGVCALCAWEGVRHARLGQRPGQLGADLPQCQLVEEGHDANPQGPCSLPWGRALPRPPCLLAARPLLPPLGRGAVQGISVRWLRQPALLPQLQAASEPDAPPYEEEEDEDEEKLPITPCQVSGIKGRWVLSNTGGYEWRFYPCAPSEPKRPSGWVAQLVRKGIQEINIVGDSHQRVMSFHLRYLLSGVADERMVRSHEDMNFTVTDERKGKELRINFYWVDGIYRNREYGCSLRGQYTHNYHTFPNISTTANVTVIEGGYWAGKWCAEPLQALRARLPEFFIWALLAARDNRARVVFRTPPPVPNAGSHCSDYAVKRGFAGPATNLYLAAANRHARQLAASVTRGAEMAVFDSWAVEAPRYGDTCPGDHHYSCFVGGQKRAKPVVRGAVGDAVARTFLHFLLHSLPMESSRTAEEQKNT
ncbi:unnamed protein product [Closterium sp. Yama58-4]|nr:unnamed protein product [Closterium sp. Yama58-4]